MREQEKKNRNKKEESRYRQREDLKQDTRSCNFAAPGYEKEPSSNALIGRRDCENGFH
jgi:hypothetical protein